MEVEDDGLAVKFCGAIGSSTERGNHSQGK